MKNRAVISVIALAAVAGATVGYQCWQLQRLSIQAHEQTQAIMEGYSDIVSEYVVPLMGNAAISPEQEAYARRVKAILSDVPSAATVEDALNGISNAQAELTGFVRAAPVTLQSDPAMRQLTQEMGERGEIRTLLQEYNTTALRWNTTLKGIIGSVAAAVGGIEQNPLPFLRFDGKQEFVTEVSL